MRRNIEGTYTGCICSNNIGDDVLYWVFKRIMELTLTQMGVPVEIKTGSPSNYKKDGDFVVVGGGTIVHPEEVSYTKVLGHHLLSSLIFGTGILPDLTITQKNYDLISERRYRELEYADNEIINRNMKYLSTAHHGGFRGPLSVHTYERVLGSCPFKVLYDPGLLAGLLAPENRTPLPVKESGIGTIGINTAEVWGVQRFRARPDGDRKEYNDRVWGVIYRLCKLLLEKGYSVAFYSMNGSDYQSNQKLYWRLICEMPIYRDRVCIIETATHEQVLFFCKECRMTVGTRLHSNILSCAVKTPSIAVAYAIKSIDFFESIGLPSFAFPTTSVLTEDALMNAVERIEADYTDIKIQLSEAISDAYSKHLSSMKSAVEESLADFTGAPITAFFSNPVHDTHTGFYLSCNKEQ